MSNSAPYEPYVEYAYDRDGNQTSEVTREAGTGTVRTRSMTYDDLNRVTFEALPGGASNTYTYDLVGNLRSLTDAGGKVEYTYDATNQIRAVYEPGTAKPTKFTHNKDGLRTKTAYPNGVTIDQAYDQAFRLASITSHTGNPASPLQQQTYRWQDPTTSRQTPLMFERTDTILGQKTAYTYDALDRLETATIRSSTTNTELAKSCGVSTADLPARDRSRSTTKTVSDRKSSVVLGTHRMNSPSAWIESPSALIRPLLRRSQMRS